MSFQTPFDESIVQGDNRISQEQVAQADNSKSLFDKPASSAKQETIANQKDATTGNTKLEFESTGRVSGDITAPTVSTPTTISRSISIHVYGSLETGSFESVNDVYVKYTLVSGPDWILSAGTDVGITQIARYNSTYQTRDSWREFVWNQPITVSYRSFNFYGWPQIVLSVYYFDTFGNDQILGYGACHLPVSNQLSSCSTQKVDIYAPQSSSMAKQILSWITGKKPELVDSALFARSDCRRVLQVVQVGQVGLKLNLTTKDVATNGYRC